MRSLDEILAYQLLSLFLTPLEYQAAHLLQMCLGLRAVVVVRRTTPEGFLIQLNLFDVGAAIDHGS